MVVTNKKTGVGYQVTDEQAARLKAGRLGKYFKYEKPAPTPPEVLEMQAVKDEVSNEGSLMKNLKKRGFAKSKIKTKPSE